MTSLSIVGNTATVNQENGSQVVFTLSNGVWTAPPRVTATLVQNADDTYTLTRMRRSFLTFDADGRLIKLEDLNGRAASPPYATTLSYNGAGRLATVTDPAGRTLTFDYWPSGYLKSVTDTASPARAVNFAYDGVGNLTDVTNVGGGVTHMTYDASHRMLTLLDPNQEGASSPTPLTLHYDGSGRVDWQKNFLGLTTTFDYATVPGSTLVTDPKGNKILHTYEAGQLVSETRGYGTPQAATWEYAYDPATLGVTSVTDPNGHVTTSDYDGRGNLTGRTIDPGGLNRVTTYTYDALNDLTQVVDPEGVPSTMTYDANGNLKTTSTPLYAADGVTVIATRTTTLGYPDAAHPGDVRTMTDPNGKVWTYTYDSAGNLATSTDPLGHKTVFCYDAVGRRTVTVNPKGSAGFGCPALTPNPPGPYMTTYSYDAFSNVLVSADALNHKTIRTYDANQNLKTLQDPNGNLTEYDYDTGNRLVEVARADATILSYEYWPDGSLKTQFDGASEATGYAYDPLGHPVSVTDPLSRSTTLSYDPVGNLISKAHPGGTCTGTPSGCTTYGYDSSNALKTISYSDGVTPNVTNIGYDDNGRRTGITDAATGTSTYEWDSLGRMTRSTDGAGRIVTYGYDLKGQLTSIGYPGGPGQTVTRAYDDAGRLDTVTDWLGNTSDVDFDDDSNLSLIDYPNGTTAEYGSDTADRLMSITDKRGANPFASFSYTRDDANLLASGSFTGVTQPNETYGYSDLNQLTSVNSTGYDYDPADNLTQMGTSTLAYDDANELTNVFGSISFVGGGANHDATGAAGSITVNLSAAPQANDQILVAVDEKAGQNAQTPAGYTLVGTFAGTGGEGEELKVFRKTAAGGEGASLTVSFNQGTNIHAKAVAVVIYRGVDPTNPIDVVGVKGTTAAGTSVTAPGVTTTQAGGRLVMMQSALGNTLGATWTPPAGMTDRAHSGTNIPQVAVAIADKALGAAGATGNQTATLSRSADLLGLLIALKTPPPATLYFHHDQLGSTRLLTDADGDVVATFTFDVYGKTTAKTGSATTALQFAGQYTDAESGFQYLRNRYYDAWSGQFISRDPVARITQQPYTYGTGDPVNTVDPTGLFRIPGTNWCIDIGDPNCGSIRERHAEFFQKVANGAAGVLNGMTLGHGAGVLNAIPPAQGKYNLNTPEARVGRIIGGIIDAPLAFLAPEAFGAAGVLNGFYGYYTACFAGGGSAAACKSSAFSNALSIVGGGLGAIMSSSLGSVVSLLSNYLKVEVDPIRVFLALC